MIGRVPCVHSNLLKERRDLCCIEALNCLLKSIDIYCVMSLFYLYFINSLCLKLFYYCNFIIDLVVNEYYIWLTGLYHLPLLHDIIAHAQILFPVFFFLYWNVNKQVNYFWFNIKIFKINLKKKPKKYKTKIVISILVDSLKKNRDFGSIWYIKSALNMNVHVYSIYP